MKNLSFIWKLIFVLIVFVAYSFSTVKKNETFLNEFTEEFSKKKNPEDIQKFLSDFENAVINHDTKTVMSLMDLHYKAEQHDDMLKGNTNQFLNEFFCGSETDNDEFICLDFKDITKIELLNLNKTDDGYQVDYLVSSTNYYIKCNWIITITSSGNILVYGLYGAVG